MAAIAVHFIGVQWGVRLSQVGHAGFPYSQGVNLAVFCYGYVLTLHLPLALLVPFSLPFGVPLS